MSSNKANPRTCLGFVGLGAMGLPIATNLLRAGFSLQVHTRSRTTETCKQLKGAKACPSPKDAAKGCDVFLICVSDEEAVEAVLFGDYGAQSSLKPGTIVIDLSTISPKMAKAFAAKLAENNIIYIDAPVTGGTEGAIAGTLTIFLGGNHDFLKKISAILNTIASKVYPFGAVGKGQEVKAINQILVAGSYAAVAEAIALGQELRLPMNVVIEALNQGAASSWPLANRSQSMLDNHYPLGFKLELHHKDLSIALEIAKNSRLNLPITLKVKELEEELIKEGYSQDDISILIKSIKKTI